MHQPIFHNVTQFQFFLEVSDVRSPNCANYYKLLLSAILRVPLKKEEYDLLVDFKDIRNSNCHCSINDTRKLFEVLVARDDARKLFEVLVARDDAYLTENQKSVRDIVVKSLRA